MADFTSEELQNSGRYDFLKGFYSDDLSTLKLVNSSISSQSFDGSIPHQIFTGPLYYKESGVFSISPGDKIKIDHEDNGNPSFYSVIAIRTNPSLEYTGYVGQTQDGGAGELPLKSFTSNVFIDYLGFDGIIYTHEIETTLDGDGYPNNEITFTQEVWEEKSLGSNGWMITAAGNAIFNNLAVRGEINATSGNFDGYITVNNGTMKIGSGISETTDPDPEIGTYLNDGIYINNSNYWYSDGTISIGDGTKSIVYDGTDVTIGADVIINADLTANSLTIDSNNYWNSSTYGATGDFRIGNGSSYVLWDESEDTLNVTGTINASGGNFSNTVYVGTNGTASNNIQLIGTSTASSTAIGIGTGSLGYNTSNTKFWADASGRFSLSNRMIFDGQDLTLAGGSGVNSITFDLSNSTAVTASVQETVEGSSTIDAASGVDFITSGFKVNMFITGYGIRSGSYITNLTTTSMTLSRVMTGGATTITGYNKMFGAGAQDTDYLVATSATVSIIGGSLAATIFLSGGNTSSLRTGQMITATNGTGSIPGAAIIASIIDSTTIDVVSSNSFTAGTVTNVYASSPMWIDSGGNISALSGKIGNFTLAEDGLIGSKVTIDETGMYFYDSLASLFEGGAMASVSTDYEGSMYIATGSTFSAYANQIPGGFTAYNLAGGNIFSARPSYYTDSFGGTTYFDGTAQILSTFNITEPYSGTATLSFTGNSDISGSTTSNTFYAPNWFRSTGNSGWYSQTYGGGIYMVDTTWVRTYNNKAFYANNVIRAQGGLESNAGLSVYSDAYANRYLLTENVPTEAAYYGSDYMYDGNASSSGRKTLYISDTGTAPDHRITVAPSGRKFKTDITEFILDDSKIEDYLSRTPVTFLYTSSLEEAVARGLPESSVARDVGFIADEFQEVDLEYLYQTDNTGYADYIAYDKMPVYNFIVIKKQQERIKNLEDTIKLMENRLAALEAK